MLTRLQANGFKTFEDLDIELQPFTVVVGSNAAGKSNLFDVLQLLSNLAERDVNEAIRNLRGEPSELFRTTADGRSSRIGLAVEVLVDPVVVDSYGSRVTLKHTRMRYEIMLERREIRPSVDRIYVVEERATPIPVGKDTWADGIRPDRRAHSPYLMYSGRRSPYLTTERGKSGPEFSIGQDGKQGRVRPASAAEATVLYSVTNSAEFPHLFALRAELASWRLLQLDPTLLRSSSPATASDELEPDGSNLAATLAAIKAETSTEDNPEGALGDIALQLGGMIGGIDSVDADLDESRREYRVELKMRDGITFSSRVVSDGTLRILALLALLHDPRRRGLVFFEEPENGIHPARVRKLIGILRRMVTNIFPEDADEEFDGPVEPLGQLLLNSHSPVVLAALVNQDLETVRGSILFADMVSVVDRGTGNTRRRSRFRPVRRIRDKERQQDAFSDPTVEPELVSDMEVLDVLDTVGEEA